MSNDEFLNAMNSKVRSHPERASYDINVAKKILRDGKYGVLSTIYGPNEPHAVPMMYLLEESHIELHGRRNTRLMNTLISGTPLVFTVTLIDGIVLAKNVRMHSLNYRSLIIHGVASEITNSNLKKNSFIKLAEKHGGRRSGVSPPTEAQLNSVNLLAVNIDRFSIKIRRGPPAPPLPGDREDVWSGEVRYGKRSITYIPDEYTDTLTECPSDI